MLAALQRAHSEFEGKRKQIPPQLMQNFLERDLTSERMAKCLEVNYSKIIIPRNEWNPQVVGNLLMQSPEGRASFLTFKGGINLHAPQLEQNENKI